ncbi:YveK family protein [Neobacillus sp. BF23-41]|uniref:YveK family protein n=1 Tax=Neobacillus sp. BF23-41 TaxID=3240280 RepID=UPI0034E3BE83
MEETIDLKELLLILKKRLLLIITIVLLAGIASGLFTYFYLTPMYQSSTKLLINQTKEDQSSVNSANLQGQVQGNLQLIDTYNEIIKSSAILVKVAEKLNTGITVEQLISEITLASSENSQVVTIVVKDASAEQAAKIADTTAEVFQTEIVKIMKIDNVNILDYATVNPSPVDPKPTLNIAIGIVVGLMLGIAVAFLLDYFDNTLKNEKDIERELGLPVIGMITKIDEIKLEEKVSRRADKSLARGEYLGS